MQTLKTQYPKNSGNAVHYGVLVVHPRDGVVDRELQLAAPAQHPQYGTAYC